MLSFLATHPPRTQVSSLPRLTFDDGASWIEFCSPYSRFLVRNHWPPASAGSSIGFNSRIEPPFKPQCSLHPPLHWHRFQSETFHVLKGTAKFSVDGKEIVIGEGSEVTVPRAAFHSFCNASSSEEMEIEFVLTPKWRKRDEAYFRKCKWLRTTTAAFLILKCFLIPSSDTPCFMRMGQRK
jgi:mannose-6-phosphate isomerase-like protein (cupin superfamily)